MEKASTSEGLELETREQLPIQANEKHEKNMAYKMSDISAERLREEETLS